jgi:hypothetical protein
VKQPTATVFPPIMYAFVHHESCRYKIDRPWVKDGKAYATDGRRLICVEMPGEPDSAARDGEFPYPPCHDIIALLQRDIDAGQYRPVPHPLYVPPGTKPCDECRATGKIGCNCPTCDWDNQHDCKACEGSGKKNVPGHVQLGAAWFNIELLHAVLMDGADLHAHQTEWNKPLYADSPAGSPVKYRAVVMPTTGPTNGAAA